MFMNANGVPRLRPPTAFQIEAQGREPCERTLGRDEKRSVLPRRGYIVLLRFATTPIDLLERFDFGRKLDGWYTASTSVLMM